MDADGYDYSSAQERRDSGLGDFTSGVLAPDLDSPSGESGPPGSGPANQRVPVRRQSRIAINSSHFTLRFGGGDGQREDFEVVAAVHNRPTTLREAIESVLESRNLDINNVNVFIEKSRTPLPINSDTTFLAGNTLEIKEKDDKDGDGSNQGKQRNNNSNAKSGSTKGNKQGRNSRRDSVGVVPLLLEPPPTKQRRGSLQLPFREHFFNKGGGGGGSAPDSSKGTDALKVYDDNFEKRGSLRGRGRAPNLSVDDTFYPPMSPQGTWTEGTSKKNKSQKLSVVNLFTPGNKDRERQDQLSELLGRYSAHGLPPLPELLALGRPRLDEASLMMLDLEPHWHSIVDNSQNMTKKQQEHQEAVWELIHTEVSYIKQIRVIMDVFQNCLINVHQEGFLNEIETERLFSNIDKIFECNCLFWQEYMLPVVLRSRDTRTRLDPLLAREGFVDHFPILFQVYFKYFIEHKSCLEYAKSRMENSDLFKTFILWAEAQKQCNRLKLADILVKPMQRLLKYSLLLQAILKHTENEMESVAIREMIESVEKLCWAANTSLQRREDYEKLEAVRKTIDLYDAIEAPNDECAKIIQEYNGNFNLLAPMPGFREGQPRSLLSHSSLRMKEAQAAKVDVDCLLFTDLILICKSNRKMDRFKIIRPPMRLDQLVVSELKDKGSFLLIYMNEYHVPISAFTFHSDVSAIRAWLERFRDAQKDYKVKKIQESAELERIRSGGAHEEVHYTPIISVPNDLDLTGGSGFPRSESMESADRFIPNLLLSPQADDAFGKLPAEIGRSGSTGDIYGQQFAPASVSASGSASSFGGSNLAPAATASGSSLGSSSSSLPQTAASNGVNADSNSVLASRPPPVPVGVERTSPGSFSSSLLPSQQSQGGPPGSPASFHKPIHACRSVPNIQVGNDGAASSSSNINLGQNVGQNPNWTHNNCSGPPAQSSSSPSVPHRTIINVNANKDGSSGNHISQYGLPQQQHAQQQVVYSKQYQQHSNPNYDVSSSPYSPSITDAVDQSASANIDISDSQVPLGYLAAGDQGSVFDEDELSRMKLASRRTSRAEKRYHTADSITDMKPSQEKDASIHKRLSWRTDVQVVDNKNLGSPNKALSTDSVRSYPSSSGVSSTGSLHLNLESDISEESEVSGFGGSSEINVASPTQSRNMFTVGDVPDLDLQAIDSNYDDANNNNINNINTRPGEPVSTGDYLGVEEEECSLSDSSQGRSKSSPDLVAMLNNSLHVSEMEDGIASVAVSSDAFNRKLTHADILKMKKLKHQVLYDANVESSEV